MGIIRAAVESIKGGFADQWLEVVSAAPMGPTTLMTRGIATRPNDSRNSNKKGTSDIISNGSVLQVYDNQFMILVDGGRIVDYTAEPGYYKVENTAAPSLFNGQFGDSLSEAFGRIKFGGVPSSAQRVYYINLKELQGIKFGTPAPVMYFDNFYRANFYIRAFGNYSIKIINPLQFYSSVMSYSSDSLDFNDVKDQYNSEFLTAFQAALNQMSVDGHQIFHIPAKGMELTKYMEAILDDEWGALRGLDVVKVGVSSVSPDDNSRKIMDRHAEGAVLSDPSIREGYVQGSVARGMEAAGSNTGGAANAFFGMGMGMNQAGGFAGQTSAANLTQMNMQQQYAPAAPSAPQAVAQPVQAPTQTENSWTCSCGNASSTNFCPICGNKRFESNKQVCTKCNYENPNEPVKFCPNCGNQLT